MSCVGWTALRPVQELSGAVVLDGKNVVILAPTAGGKTEAAVFPVLAGLMERPPSAVGAIYLAPIKALLNNQEERIGTYAEMVGLRRFVWHGDTKQGAKRSFVREPAEVLMTTPESLEVMLLSPRVPVAKLFADLRYLVVDEIHAFAGTDRGAHLLSVVERLARATPNDIQRIGLSATVGNPDHILAWLRGSSQRDGAVVAAPKIPSKKNLLVRVLPGVTSLAEHVARTGSGKKSLFFCQSRSLAETVADRLRGAAIDVFVHHSSVSLEERRAAEERFHGGTNACIVCTSTLELGIDVGDLDLVYQVNAPSTVSSFLQKMGRTGRRPGQSPNTTFLCEDAAAAFQAVALIELAREGWVESIPPQDRSWPVLVHQILALTLQYGAVSAERCWDELSVVPDFRGIARAEFDALLEHMVREDFLFLSGGLLSMGSRAERIFGRKNFAELYAVFSSPVMYRVQTGAGREIGSLEQDFVDGLVDEMTSFLLGGRAWTVENVNHAERAVRVRAAPRGEKPSWGGFVPQLLSFDVCQRVKRVLMADEDFPYLDAAAKNALAEHRREFAPLFRRPGPSLQFDDGVMRWWTFAGGRINHTIKYAMSVLGDWKVVADNHVLRLKGDGLTSLDVRNAIQRMAAPGFWDLETTRFSILARLPAYRLSKFQPLLPAAVAMEAVASYLLDFPGAARFVGGIEALG